MAIAPIPNSNTTPTPANSTTSSSPMGTAAATATQGTGTTAKGNLSTTDELSKLQVQVNALNNNISTYALNANPSQANGGVLASLTQLTPESAKNILSFLMEVMADLSIAMRKTAMENRQQDLLNQIDSLLSQVKSMRDAADKNYNASMASAITGILMGLVTVTMGSLALLKTMKAKTDLADMKTALNDPNAKADAFTLAKSNADYKIGLGTSLSQTGNSINGLGNSIGSAVSAQEKYDADMASALAQKLAADATKYAAMYEQDNNFFQSFGQAVSASLQAATTMSSTSANTSQSITKNMV